MEEQDVSFDHDREKRSRFATDLGRLFEIGFNTGLLAAIRHKKALVSHFDDRYQHDLSHLSFPVLAEVMYKRQGIVSSWDKGTLERWLLFFVQKGFLAGENFFAEYLQSFAHINPYTTREIVYLQCNFYGENSFGTYTKNDQSVAQELMEQFHQQGYTFSWTDDNFRTYSSKGNFLKADTLLLLKVGKQWRILSVDESVFSINALAEATDLTSIEHIRRMLAREIHYVRSKSVFANLSFDTDVETASTEIISGKLQHYFTAFKRKDKESAKFIQAASYAYSFYDFLTEKGILAANDEVILNVVGYTDRGMNAMTVRKEQIQLLATCAEIYKKHEADEEIAGARHHVLETIQRAAAKSFIDGRTFTNRLVHLADDDEGVRWLEHTETLEDFVNTRSPLDLACLSAEVRNRLEPGEYEGRHILDIHAALTKKELAGHTPYLFLTGNPGIGKTTAIVNYLKTRARQGEGFLFLYISPRKQVNLDIIKKFQEDTGEPPCENLFALTTNSLIIRNNHTHPTVHYYSQQRQDTFRANGVEFLCAEGERAKEQRTSRRHLEEIQEGLLIDKGERISGVLSSLCRALQASITTLEPKAIVATVAIQSLKRTKSGKDTLQHLEMIFQGAYSTHGGVIPAQMEKIGKRIQHLFVMIDEVTGDESGAEFLEGIHAFLHKYDLIDSKYGINTKIIVADASIIDPQIIQRHLAETTYEPNKIYFRRVVSQEAAPPLSIQSSTFKRKPAVVINANAYPASRLHVTYKIGVDVLRYDEESFIERSKQLRPAVQSRITKDIVAVMDQPDPPQVLVYIQDKQRLAQLIQEISKVRDGAFHVNQDYLEIHANISEEDKKSIAEMQHKVNVVFMTASASRGLSFHRARHILVDIPHFEIEQNLMEILQVIYRGRGGDYDQQEKWLTFYLADGIIYTDTADRELSVRESMLHLLNVLLILKTSMMTRIVGSGKLGVNQQFMMIPIGGKSVSAAGDTFTSRMSRLIKELQDVSHSNWKDQRLKYVSESLTHILSDARIRLIASNDGRKAPDDEPPGQAYLTLLPLFAHNFSTAIGKGFQHLLDLPALEKGYVSGNLLVVPIGGKSMQEEYWMEVEDVFEQKDRKLDLLTCMRELSKDRHYPESMQMALKDAIALIESLRQIPETKRPHYQQESDHSDQHYALPLVAFLTYDVMKAYFGSKPEREEQTEASFRALLASYVRTLYPADSILPIGKSYDVFPFVVFRCLNLAEARRKMFTDKYLFMSHEFNILNMLLSSKE